MLAKQTTRDSATLAEPVRVLLIDDEADTLLPTLAQDLKPLGFSFSKETRAARTFDAVLSNPPDVLLLDLHFPGDDRRRDGRTTGGELLTEIRRRFVSVPVIIFTTRLDDHDIPLEAFEERPHGRFAKSMLERDSGWPTALAQAMRDAISTVRFEREAQDGDLGFLVGQSKEMHEVAALILTAARNRLPVLIYGETGTGKQRAAEAIHRLSSRTGRFEQINCAGVDEHTLESRLFGHERGAYTGAAAAREGLFELTDQGTLFLDEIQRMPMALQDKLMLTVEQGRTRRMGANTDRTVNVRLIAATNHNLSDLVADGVLREDLAHRLAGGLLIALPPLKARMADLPALFEHFVAKANQANERHVLSVLRAETRARLESHDWPGNIRELEATLSRAVTITSSNVLLPADIQFAPLARRRQIAPSAPMSEPISAEAAASNSAPSSASMRSDLISPLCDRLQDLPIGQRYGFLRDQENGLRRDVLIEFIARLRLSKGRKIGHKELAVALDPCNNGETDFARIRQFVSSCDVQLTKLECNQ